MGQSASTELKPREDQYPLVTVLVPIFNHAGFVAECLESLREDAYPRLQVIALDDGSSDSSFAVARGWRQDNPGVFEDFQLLHQANAGLPSALNRMIQLARGDFVALLASDDLVLPGGIAARVSSLQQHPEWLAVMGDCIVIDQDRRRLSDSGLRYSPNGNPLLRANKTALSHPEWIVDELILRWSVPGPVILLRREAYDADVGVGPYDETLQITDRDLYLRLLVRRALGFLDRPVAAYRLHSDNSIRRKSFGPHLAQAIGAAEARNARSFAGRQRTLVGLAAFKSANYASLLRKVTINRVLIAGCLHLLIEVFCICHDVRVAVASRFGRARSSAGSLSANGAKPLRHASTEVP